MTASSRGLVAAAALALLSAFLVWNGIFGLHVSRGEKQYLLEEARYELGERAMPSMSVIMDDTVREGARQATHWALVVGGLGLTAVYAAYRAARRPQ